MAAMRLRARTARTTAVCLDFENRVVARSSLNLIKVRTEKSGIISAHLCLGCGTGGCLPFPCKVRARLKLPAFCATEHCHELGILLLIRALRIVLAVGG